MKERLEQFRQAWQQLKQVDDRAVTMIAAAALVGAPGGAGLGLLLGAWYWAVVFALLLASLGALLVFNRRVQAAQFTAIEGHPGAAAAVLNAMRGQWFVTPAVAVTAKQDMVHRVIGRPGVVLVGEGSRQRVKGLLAKERKRLSRVVGETPIHVVVVGEGGTDDEVSIRKLQFRLSKLPRELKKDQIPKLERKLKPLDKGPGIPGGVDPNAASRRARPQPR